MSNADQIRAVAPEFLRIVRDVGMNQGSPTVSVYQVDKHLDRASLGASSFDSPESLVDVAQYLGQRGLLKRQVYGWGGFSITREGIDEVEGRNEGHQTNITNTFNVSGNLYNPVIGTHNIANFTGDFDFSTVERHIEEDANAEDREELRQLVAEVRELVESGQTINKGFLARWNDKLKEYGWLSGAVAGWLLNFSTQG